MKYFNKKEGRQILRANSFQHQGNCYPTIDLMYTYIFFDDTAPHATYG